MSITLDVISLTEFLGEELTKRMDKLTFRFKKTDSLDQADYFEVKPTVETLTYEDINEDGYTTHMPSVLVQPVSEEDGVYHYVVFVCVCMPAVQGVEQTLPVEGMPGVYQHRDSPDYTAYGARRDLFKTAVLLTEQVALAIKRIGNTNASISAIQTSYPSPLLPDIPYCSGTVEFDARIPQTASTIDTRVRELL